MPPLVKEFFPTLTVSYLDCVLLFVGLLQEKDFFPGFRCTWILHWPFFYSCKLQLHIAEPIRFHHNWDYFSSGTKKKKKNLNEQKTIFSKEKELKTQMQGRLSWL